MRHSAQFLLVAALAVSPLAHASESAPAQIREETGPPASTAPAVAAGSDTSASDESGGEALPDVDLAILLDPDENPGTRQDHLDLLERHAAQGDGWANYVLGSLYRLGMQHPAELVPRDAGRATSHLREAALAGQTFAMSGLAELLLVERQPRVALVWAHAFTHYRQVYEQLAGHPADTRRPYAASLLLRCRTALERSNGDRSPIQAELDAFVARHDAGIRAGMVKSRQAVAGKLEDRPANNLEYVPRRRRGDMVEAGAPGLALYRIGVGRNGRVERVLIVDSAPDRRYGWRMRSLARATRFNPSPDADPLRWALLPMEYTDNSVSLRRKDDDQD